MMNVRQLVTLVAATCVGLAAGACGDDEGGTGGSGAGGQGAGGQGAGGQGAGGGGGAAGEAGQGGGGGDTVQVTVAVFDWEDQPLELAGVAVDMADDSRFEGLTDAQGEVVLALPAGVDVASMIAHKDGFSFFAIPGALLAGESYWEVAIGRDDDGSPMVDVSGNALNMADPANDWLLVHSSTFGSFTEKGTDAYSLQVPTGEAFTLVGVDFGTPIINGQDATRLWNSVVVMSNPPISASTTIDLDFASPTAPSTTFNTSFALPADAALATGGVAMIEAFAQPDVPLVLVGGSTSCTRGVDTFDCDGQLWDVAGVAGATAYWVVEPAHLSTLSAVFVGRFVQKWIQGEPIAGLVDGDVPNPPDVITPAGPGPHPLDTPVEFTIANGGGTYDYVLAQVNAGMRLVGMAFTHEGRVCMPPLPSSSNPATVYESTMQFIVFTGRIEWGGIATAVGAQAWIATPPEG